MSISLVRRDRPYGLAATEPPRTYGMPRLSKTSQTWRTICRISRSMRSIFWLPAVGGPQELGFDPVRGQAHAALVLGCVWVPAAYLGPLKVGDCLNHIANRIEVLPGRL